MLLFSISTLIQVIIRWEEMGWTLWLYLFAMLFFNLALINTFRPIEFLSKYLTMTDQSLVIHQMFGRKTKVQLSDIEEIRITYDFLFVKTTHQNIKLLFSSFTDPKKDVSTFFDQNLPESIKERLMPA